MLTNGLQLDMPPILGPMSLKTVIIERNDNAEGIIEFAGSTLFEGMKWDQCLYRVLCGIIELVAIKTLQSLHAEVRVINGSFETNLDCTKVTRKFCLPFVSLKSII